MADLSEAIRAKLASWGDDPCGYATCVVVGWIEMRDALTAVLDLHGNIDGGFDETRRCSHCEHSMSMPGGFWPVQRHYPCPTVLEIAKSLGIEACDG